MNLVFTICSNNYLAQAISLGASLLRHNPDYIFKIGLVDRRNEMIQYDQISYELVEVENIGISSFDDMFKQYSITELNTAVKPFYFKYFFSLIPKIDRIIYLDPDIMVYSPFAELDKVLEENEIVITPHFTTPIDDDRFQAENDFLNSGLYNLGFIALKKGIESQKLIEWWAKRLETKAFISFAKGMFTDQIWINFAPLFFDRVHILLHPGYNMAYWNLHERILKDSKMVIKKNISYPLVFFHFSGFNPLRPDVLSKYQDRFSFENRKDIVNLFVEYSSMIKSNKYFENADIPCYYVIEKNKIDLISATKIARSVPLFKKALKKIIRFTIKALKIEL